MTIESKKRGADRVADNVHNVLRDEIMPDPNQPRMVFDEDGLRELSESIESNGLLQPISIRPAPDGDEGDARYIIIAGERRWMATGLIGWDTVPAIIKEHLTEEEAAKLQLLENIVRRDLNPVEEAQALQRMLEEGYSLEELGATLGITAGKVTYKIKLLDAREDILQMVVAGTIQYNYAHTIARLLHSDQGRVLAALNKKRLSYVEVHNLCDRIIDLNSQTDMAFNLQPMTAEEQAAVATFDKAFLQVTKALSELNDMESEKPGSLSAALGAKAGLVESQIDEATKGLNRIKKALRTSRMANMAEDI